jgi:hypothetical protein
MICGVVATSISVICETNYGLEMFLSDKIDKVIPIKALISLPCIALLCWYYCK